MSRMEKLANLVASVGRDQSGKLVFTAEGPRPRGTEVTDKDREELILVEYINQGYAHVNYRVHSMDLVSRLHITDTELIDLCDGGYNFGGIVCGSDVKVYID